MAKKINNTQICNFIKLIAPDVQEAYKTLGKVKPSVCIGMAIVESGAGTSEIMMRHNALWGQKVGSGKTALKYWNGSSYNARTKEEYTKGKLTEIRDNFRSYESVLQGALNYYELLNTSLYARVRSDQGYKVQMQAIKDCGYMTSSDEVNTVLTYINSFALTKYDFAPDIVEIQDNPYRLDAVCLKKGMRGESVKWLQYELNRYGYALAVDGVYGVKTYNAVRSYQRPRGLMVDGIAGKNTLRSLQDRG